MVRYVPQSPARAIENCICEMWLLDDDGAPQVGLPKPFVEIVVSLEGVHFWKADEDAQEFEYRLGWVTPIQDGPRFARATGRRKLIGARLYPWVANAWLGTLAKGDGTPPTYLANLFGAEANNLREWLTQSPDEETVFSRFGLWLAGHLEPLEQEKHKLQDAQVGLTDTVEALAKSVNVSGPTLRRSFASQNGMSPKRWLILRRIDKLLRDPRLSDPSISLAQLAAEYGYADQAHLSREVLRFAGTSPGIIRSRNPDYPPHMRDA